MDEFLITYKGTPDTTSPGSYTYNFNNPNIPPVNIPPITVIINRTDEGVFPEVISYTIVCPNFETSDRFTVIANEFNDGIISIDPTNFPTNVPKPAVKFSTHINFCAENQTTPRNCVSDNSDLSFVLSLHSTQVYQVTYYLIMLANSCACARISINSQSSHVQDNNATTTTTMTMTNSSLATNTRILNNQSISSTISQRNQHIQNNQQILPIISQNNNLVPCNNCNQNTYNEQDKINANKRLNMTLINSIMETCYTAGSASGTVQPKVIIAALNTVDGLEVSEIGVTVIDEYNYKICKNKLIVTSANVIDATSKFALYHPEFSDVIQGCGCTFVEKLIDLVGYNYDTYIPILVYAIIKYTIATLVYGNANLKYLYQSFNTQFLIDLQNSHFSNFYPIFTVPSPPLYDFTQTYKYFLWNKYTKTECKTSENIIQNNCTCDRCSPCKRKNYHRIWNECTDEYENCNKKPIHRIWNQ